MPKLRCSICDSYVDRNTIYRRTGLQSFCSPECFTAQRTHTEAKAKVHRRKVSKRKSEGDISSEMRLEIYVRDHYRCRFCGTKSDLHIHHIKYRSQGGPGENWNLITLCGEHHGVVHSNKGHWMPLCRGVIWMTYMRHSHIRIPQLERWLDNEAFWMAAQDQALAQARRPLGEGR